MFMNVYENSKTFITCWTSSHRAHTCDTSLTNKHKIHSPWLIHAIPHSQTNLKHTHHKRLFTHKQTWDMQYTHRDSYMWLRTPKQTWDMKYTHHDLHMRLLTPKQTWDMKYTHHDSHMRLLTSKQTWDMKYTRHDSYMLLRTQKET